MLSKKKKMIGVAVAVIVCLSVVGVWKITEPKEGNYPHFYTVDWTIDNTTDAWIINITNVTLHGRWDAEFNLSGKHVQYRIAGHISEQRIRTLNEIDGVICEYYNITWIDKDNNNMLSDGDSIILSKTGGTGGKTESGERVILIHTQDTSGLLCVVLP